MIRKEASFPLLKVIHQTSKNFRYEKDRLNDRYLCSSCIACWLQKGP